MNYRVEGTNADGYEGDVNVVELSEVKEILDDIETKIREALRQIDGIGIDNIDNCKKILDRLLESLC